MHCGCAQTQHASLWVSVRCLSVLRGTACDCKAVYVNMVGNTCVAMVNHGQGTSAMLQVMLGGGCSLVLGSVMTGDESRQVMTRLGVIPH